jgi:hypothetical protein
MINPPKATVYYNYEDVTMNTVLEKDYNRLLKYCDQLQAEKVALADLVGQYSKLSNDSDEIESIKLAEPVA